MPHATEASLVPFSALVENTTQPLSNAAALTVVFQDTKHSIGDIMQSMEGQDALYIIPEEPKDAIEKGNSGGLSYVMEGLDPRTNTPVAVSAQIREDIIHPNVHAIQQYIALAADHPELLDVYGVGMVKQWENVRDRLLMVLEWCPEPTLSEKICELVDENSEWNFATYMNTLNSALSALQLLHSNGLVHGDVHSDNFLIKNGQSYLSDFGTMKEPGPIYTADRVGKPGIPPECADPHSFPPSQRQYNDKTDTWRMGELYLPGLGLRNPDELTGHQTPLQRRHYDLYLACKSSSPALRPTAEELQQANHYLWDSLSEQDRKHESLCARANEMWKRIDEQEVDLATIEHVLNAFIHVALSYQDRNEVVPESLHAQLGKLHFRALEIGGEAKRHSESARKHYESALSYTSDPDEIRILVERLCQIGRYDTQYGNRWLETDAYLEESPHKNSFAFDRMLQDDPEMSYFPLLLERIGETPCIRIDELQHVLSDSNNPREWWGKLTPESQLHYRTVLLHYFRNAILAAKQTDQDEQQDKSKALVAFRHAFAASQLLPLLTDDLPADYWSHRSSVIEYLMVYDENLNDPLYEMHETEFFNGIARAVAHPKADAWVRSHAVAAYRLHGKDSDAMSVIRNTSLLDRTPEMWRVLSMLSDDPQEIEDARNRARVLDTTNIDTNMLLTERLIDQKPINAPMLYAHIARVFSADNPDATESVEIFLQANYTTLLDPLLLESAGPQYRKDIFRIFALWQEQSQNATAIIQAFSEACSQLRRYKEWEEVTQQLGTQFPAIQDALILHPLEDFDESEQSFVYDPLSPESEAKQQSITFRGNTALHVQDTSAHTIDAPLRELADIVQMHAATDFTLNTLLRQQLPICSATYHAYEEKDGEQRFTLDEQSRFGDFIPSHQELHRVAKTPEVHLATSSFGEDETITTLSLPVKSDETLLGILQVVYRSEKGKESLQHSDIATLSTASFHLGETNKRRERQNLERKAITIGKHQQEFMSSVAEDIYPGYRMSVAAYSDKQGGGDGHLVVPMADGRCFFTIYDVAGHDLGSVAHQVFILGYLRGALARASKDTTLEEVFKGLNKELCEGDYTKHATGFFGMITPGNTHDTIEYIDAGHGTPYILEKDGSISDRNSAPEQESPVGFVYNADDPVSINRVSIGPGEMFLAHTDGVDEAGNTFDPVNLIGHEGVRSMIEHYDGDMIDLPATMMHMAEDHNQGAHPDDITVLGMLKT